jgi:3-hydroxyacyl-CoA dehydrogenase
VVFARSGLPVRLWDRDPSALGSAMDSIAAALADLKDSDPDLDIQKAMSCIRGVDSLEEAVSGAGYVQESAAEALEAKQSLFQRMDVAAPSDAILASSTSAIPGSAIFADIAGRARCLVVHPVNPPHMIPLVEICPTPWTAEDVVKAARSLMSEVGQAPVTLNKEAPGFLLNRLQWALLGEALHLVGEGYCSADDIDRVLTQGLALRWAFIGPFEVGHLNATGGLAGYFSGLADAMRRVRESLEADYVAPPDLIERLHAGMAERVPVTAIPAHQAWRDNRILKLRAHLADAAARPSQTARPEA